MPFLHRLCKNSWRPFKRTLLSQAPVQYLVDCACPGDYFENSLRLHAFLSVSRYIGSRTRARKSLRRTKRRSKKLPRRQRPLRKSLDLRFLGLPAFYCIDYEKEKCRSMNGRNLEQGSNFRQLHIYYTILCCNWDLLIRSTHLLHLGFALPADERRSFLKS
jgi:hypothetical protein